MWAGDATAATSNGGETLSVKETSADTADRGRQTACDCEQASKDYRKLVGAAFDSSDALNAR